MSKPWRNFVAYVSEPNTPESDQELFVWHTVKYDVEGSGTKTVEVYASCPIAAIEMVCEDLEKLGNEHICT